MDFTKKCEKNAANTQNPGACMPVFPDIELKIGCNNEYVRHVQHCLNRVARRCPNFGQYHQAIGCLEENGIFCQKTHESVKAFQTVFGLEVDGIIGMITWVRLSHECGRTREPDTGTARLTARDTLIFLSLRRLLR